MISGTATDAGGGEVGGVEVSIDGGATWQPAEGRGSWTYSWTPSATGQATIRTRAADDSGNLETPGAGNRRRGRPGELPCSIWSDSVVAADRERPGRGRARGQVPLRRGGGRSPACASTRARPTPAPTSATCGRRAARCSPRPPSAARAPRAGSRWSSRRRSRSTPNTTYVASYHAPNGNYAATNGYFSGAGGRQPAAARAGRRPRRRERRLPLRPGRRSSRPAPSSRATTGSTSSSTTTPVRTRPRPTITSVAPPAGGTGAPPRRTNVTATFNEAIDPATINGATFELRDSSNALGPVDRHLFGCEPDGDPRPRRRARQLHHLHGDGQGRRPAGVTDAAGNERRSDHSWSFTTAAPPPPPPDEGPGGPILVVGNAANPFSRYYAEILRGRGPERVHRHRPLGCRRRHPRRLRRRHPRRDGAQRRPGARCSPTG